MFTRLDIEARASRPSTRQDPYKETYTEHTQENVPLEKFGDVCMLKHVVEKHTVPLKGLFVS